MQNACEKVGRIGSGVKRQVHKMAMSPHHMPGGGYAGMAGVCRNMSHRHVAGKVLQLKI